MKYIISFLAIFIMHGLSAQVNLSSGLVAFYPFNGNATDASGNGFNGTVVSATLVNNKQGYSSSAYSFNGSNQYIRFGDILDSVFCKSPIAKFSISGWAKSNTWSAFQGGNILIAKTAGGSGPDQWLINHDNDGYLKVVVKSNSLTNFVEWKSSSTIPTGQWFSFTITFDGSISTASNRVSIYVNNVIGTFARSGGTMGTTCQNSSQEITIGSAHAAGNPGTPNNLYNGSVDDIRIYNRVLTSQEIDSLSRYVAPPVSSFILGQSSYGFCLGDSVNVGFSVTNKSFNANCTYTVERSDSTGSFASPVVMGSKVRSSTLTSGSDNVKILIPQNLPSANYRIRVVTDSPADTSTWANMSVGVKPIAAFSISDTAKCLLGNSFSFTNSSSISSGSLSYGWSFGDGATSQLANPSKAYTQHGTYNVTLTATSNRGCAASTSKSVQVYASPQAQFSGYNEPKCFNGNSFMFSNASVISSGSIVSHQWNFGDSTTSANQSPSKSFASAGIYTVALLVTSNKGCTASVTHPVTVNPSPVASFSVNNSGQCMPGHQFVFSNSSSISSGTISSNTWRFGDGNSSSQLSPSKTYTSTGSYNVKLIIASNSNCKDSALQTVYVYPKPSASFTVNTTAQCQNRNSFVLTNNSSISNGSISGSDWTFGDGSNSAQTSPSKTYQAYGNFTIKLVSTSNNGCKDSSSSNVTVNASPVAAFLVNNVSQCHNSNNFTFTNNSLIGSGAIQNYSWNFGDGGSSVQFQPSKTYSLAGSYTVELKAVSDMGCRDSSTQILYVNPNPFVAFHINTSVQCFNGHSFDFTNNSTVSSGTLSSHTWSFGDGNNGSTQHINAKTYAAAGNYAVQLSVTTDKGCQGSSSQNVVIKTNPSKPTVNRTGNVLMATTGTNPLQWYKDNVVISGATGNTLTVTQNGSYLIEETMNGCSARSDATVVSNIGVGIDEVQKVLVTVYPNPSETGIFIVSLPAAKVLAYTIYDQAGKLVRQVKPLSAQFEMNLSNLSTGMYYAIFETTGGTAQVKLMR